MLCSWLTRLDVNQLWESLLLRFIQNSDNSNRLEKFKFMDMEDVEMINDDTRDDNYEFDKAGKEILLKLGSG